MKQKEKQKEKQNKRRGNMEATEFSHKQDIREHTQMRDSTIVIHFTACARAHTHIHTLSILPVGYESL